MTVRIITAHVLKSPEDLRRPYWEDNLYAIAWGDVV